MYYSPKTNGLKHNSCCQHMTHSSRLKQPIKAGLSMQFGFPALKLPPFDALGIAICVSLRLQPWTSVNERGRNSIVDVLIFYRLLYTYTPLPLASQLPNRAQVYTYIPVIIPVINLLKCQRIIDAHTRIYKETCIFVNIIYVLYMYIYAKRASQITANITHMNITSKEKSNKLHLNQILW